MFLVVVCTVISGLGQTVGQLILSLVSMVAVFVTRDDQGNIDSRCAQMLAHLPASMRQVMAKFKLEGRTIVYAVCPQCHSLYAPTLDALQSNPAYPEQCTAVPDPGGDVCHAALLHSRDSANAPYRPLKSFVYQHFNDYLAGLLSDESIERAMDETCDDFMRARSDSPDQTHSIFEASFLRDFYSDQDNRTLFLDHPGSEGRYAFALFVDFFSAEGKSLHSAFASLSIIAMACLNLPPSIRYKPENLYLAGIIPGPDEPKLEKLNSYMSPLVTDLKKSWTDGVFFSRTALHPHGRLTRCGVAVGVFDLPAGRKAAALAGHSTAWFCSICDLNGRAQNLHRTDYEAWPHRNPQDMRYWAEKWRDASSVAERTKIFQAHGVRWSELWRLPYWDPTRMLVIDAMHCLYEGLIKMHCRIALGLSVENANKKEPMPPAFSWPFKEVDVSKTIGWSSGDIKHVPQIHSMLQESLPGSDDGVPEAAFKELEIRLTSKNMKSLAFVCDDLACAPTDYKPQKKRYAAALVQWRHKQPLTSSSGGTPRVVDNATISCIRSVIEDMEKPSWLNSLPSDLGLFFRTATAGSLKADEWRTFFTIVLPIALVSLWGEGTVHPTEAIARHRREVLDHTMALVSAVLVAGMHYSTQYRAKAYLEYIREYVVKLHELFPHVEPRTNKHVAFHIYDFLVAYGPIRSWWCFPFERLVGVIQNLPSNHKFGML